MTDEIVSKIVRRIRTRFNRSQNCLCCFEGQTGSGKSYAGISLACKTDPTFADALRERICFTAEKFLSVYTNKENPLRKRQAVIWDEIGGLHGAYSRDALTKKNRIISFLAQTFRYRQNLVVFSLPSWNMLDKHVRQLIHILVSMQRIDYKNKIGWGKFYHVSVGRDGKMYFKYPRDIIDGYHCVINEVGFPIPPKKVIKEYEKIRKPLIKRTA